MNVQLEIILPPVILGILTLLIFSVNAFIMESSVENRLNNDVQTFAVSTIDVLHEEFRTLRDVHLPGVSDSTFSFINADSDTVFVRRDGNRMVIRYGRVNGNPEEVHFPGRITELRFNAQPGNFLRISVSSESDIRQHARRSDRTEPVRGFAERSIYLRNLDI
jgi:hypothetical protein